MQRVVIDTNVVISSNIVKNGNPAEVMKLFYLRKIQVFYSTEILAEYKRVLAYEKLKFPTEIQIAIVNAIEIGGVLIKPTVSTFPMADETDRIFYDTAKASNSILITGNIKHYPTESFIMLPSDFISKIKI